MLTAPSGRGSDAFLGVSEPRPKGAVVALAGASAPRCRYPPIASQKRRATRGASLRRRAEMNVLRLLEPAFQRIVAEEGFTTTNGTIGVRATGILDFGTLTSLLSALPEGTFELVTHPGYSDADLRRSNTRLLASREIEREALMSIGLKNRAELVDFAQLTAD